MSLEIIKQLREKTGAGMVDCKKALDEANGDIDKAVEILRKKGIAKAAKREGREAQEGLIQMVVNEDGNEGYVVEVNAETDFVVRNDKFIGFTNELIELVRTNKPGDMAALESIAMGESTVKEALDSLSGTIGEKLTINAFDVLRSKGTVASYSHMGGRIGVLVALDKAGEKDLAYDIAMQIAAAHPKYLSPDDVPTKETDKEKEIYKEQLLKEGKPENIIDKIMEGKINKYYEDVCLLKQEYIKDDKKKIEDVLGDVKIEKFIRYTLGN
jgi:elongation factor Ts